MVKTLERYEQVGFKESEKPGTCEIEAAYTFISDVIFTVYALSIPDFLDTLYMQVQSWRTDTTTVFSK